MIKIVVKQGHKILKDNMIIQRGGDSITIGAFKAEFNEVQSFFEHDVNVIIQMNNTYSIWKARKGGHADCYKSEIKIWAAKYPTLDAVKQVVYHELGHIHHFYTDRVDFKKRTEYGLEVYAEEFAEKWMNTRYNLKYKTHYPSYKGYAERRIYNIDRKQLIKSKIKPLAKG